MGRTAVWGGVYVVAMVGATTGHAQKDACEGRGTKPDGTCRDVAPLRDPLPLPTAIEVASEPAGAEVRDEHGMFLGVTPFRLGKDSLGIGAHRLSMRLYGYEDAKQSVEMVRGRVTTVHVALIRMPLLSFVPTDDEAKGGRIYIDKRFVGALPLLDQPVSPGVHLLEAEKDDHGSWGYDVDLASGSKPRTFEVALTPLTGQLMVGDSAAPVGGATGRSLRGANVYLDPEGTEAPLNGTFLGQEPLTMPVKAGIHLVVIAPDNLPAISRLVHIGADHITYVPAVLPDLIEPEVRDGIPINAQEAARVCQSDDDSELSGEACVVLGHSAMYLTPNGVPDTVQAMLWYRRGCNARNATACFALGYLQAKALNAKGLPSAADANFRKACQARTPTRNACWARYAARLDDIPDPTRESGPRLRFKQVDDLRRKGDDDQLVVNAVIGVGVMAGYPLVAELGFAGMFSTARPGLCVDLRTAARFREYWAVGAAPDMTGTHFEGGFGGDARLTVRRIDDSFFTASLGIRASMYAPLHLAYGPVVSAGFESGQQFFEFGVLFERSALRNDQQDWSAIATVSYGYITVP